MLKYNVVLTNIYNSIRDKLCTLSMKIDHYFKTVSGKPASLTLLYVNNLLPGGSRGKKTVESSCSILTKLKMKQLSIDFGNILQLVIKPVYRHSRYDRGGGVEQKR